MVIFFYRLVMIIHKTLNNLDHSFSLSHVVEEITTKQSNSVQFIFINLLINNLIQSTKFTNFVNGKQYFKTKKAIE